MDGEGAGVEYVKHPGMNVRTREFTKRVSMNGVLQVRLVVSLLRRPETRSLQSLEYDGEAPWRSVSQENGDIDVRKLRKQKGVFFLRLLVRQQVWIRCAMHDQRLPRC